MQLILKPGHGSVDGLPLGKIHANCFQSCRSCISKIGFRLVASDRSKDAKTPAVKLQRRGPTDA
jgi:hypothetical protein